MKLERITFKASSEEDRETGLLGWISFILDGELFVDGVALRRSREGRTYLRFPSKVDSAGNRREYLSPISREADEEITSTVLSALGMTSE